VRSAEHTIGTTFSTLQDLYSRRCQTRACRIMKDPHHPNNNLFQLLGSGKCLCSHAARTKRLKPSFFPQAIRTVNSDLTSPPHPHCPSPCTHSHTHMHTSLVHSTCTHIVSLYNRTELMTYIHANICGLYFFHIFLFFILPCCFYAYLFICLAVYMPACLDFSFLLLFLL